MKGLFVANALLWAGASAISCDGIDAYLPSQSYQRGSTVIHNGIIYAASAYSPASATPQSSPRWIPIGRCAGGPAVRGTSAQGDVDCSGAFPYVAKIYPDPNTKVYFDNSLYHTSWYAGAGDRPDQSSEYGPWLLDGKCIAGTMGQGPVAYVDCTGTPGWSGAITYAEEHKFTVHSSGKKFENKYWTQGDKPDGNNVDGPWQYKGTCDSGTDNTPAPHDPNEVTPEKAPLLCTCCTGCASLNVLGPVCKDEITEEDKCYFTWCPRVGVQPDEEKCEHIKDTHQLQYWSGEMPEGQREWPHHVFVPYIDAGLAQQPPIDELADTLGVKYIVIAFAQTGAYKSTTGCQGALASAIPIKEGPTSWNSTKQGNDMFWERAANLRKKGGDFTLSFGGYNGIELADSDLCQKDVTNTTYLPEDQVVENLKNAYREAIDFLKLTHIDFDIEGNAYSSVQRNKGWVYRFKALKGLKQEYPYLKVWWTLPILPAGLTEDGYNFVDDLFASGAPVDKINVMTMDYGDDVVCPGNAMHTCEIDAIDALAKQVLEITTKQNLASQYGFTSIESVYPFLGSTAMIGLNDVVTETYSLQNAKDSMNVWKTTNRKLGIVSMWSLTRDHPCPHDYVDCTCTSHDNQHEDYEYAKIFAEWTGYSA